MLIGLVVPVMSNFKGFAELMRSVNDIVLPIVEDNWTVNRGVSKAWNDGILWAAESGCSHVMVANDDVTFTGVEPLRNLAETMDFAGLDLITPTDVKNVPDVFDSSLGENPNFAAFMIRPAEFLEKFGEFDENFKPAYFEDNDMAYRIKVGGGRYANDLRYTIRHEGSVTQFKGQGPGEERVVSHMRFRLNRDYYQAKWGGIPGEEKYSTPFNRGGSIRDW